MGEAALPLLPTRELVVFPRMVAPLFVGREKSISAIERAFSEKTPLILSSQREPGDDDPTTDDILPVGTRATVLQLFKLPDGSVKAIVEGRRAGPHRPLRGDGAALRRELHGDRPGGSGRRPVPGPGPAGGGGVRELRRAQPARAGRGPVRRRAGGGRGRDRRHRRRAPHGLDPGEAGAARDRVDRAAPHRPPRDCSPRRTPSSDSNRRSSSRCRSASRPVSARCSCRRSSRSSATRSTPRPATRRQATLPRRPSAACPRRPRASSSARSRSCVRRRR